MARVKISGMSDLNRLLRALPDRIARKVAREAVNRAAAPMLADAMINAPVLTGQLRASLTMKARKTKTGFSARIQTKDGDYAGDQFYASFHEYGSVHQPARPFMRPAFDQNVEKSIGIMTEELKKGIDEALAKENAKFERALKRANKGS